MSLEGQIRKKIKLFVQMVSLTFQNNYQTQVVGYLRNSCEQKLVVPVWLDLQLVISQVPCEVLLWSNDTFYQTEFLVVFECY